MTDEARHGAVADRDDLYEQISVDYAAPLARLARAYEANPAHRQDLLQEIHIALWRSLSSFNHECSLRTWVYRVAHNVAGTHILRNRRRRSHRLVDLDEVEVGADGFDAERHIDEGRTLEALTVLIQRLKPLDRDVIVLYLEGLPAGEISDIVGLSPGNVAIKIHRIKQILTRTFHTPAARG